MIGPFDRGRVFDAPMGRHRLARPDRAHFGSGRVADREDEIHDRSARRCEFVPALRPQLVGRVVEAFKHLERERIDRAFGVASGREGAEAPAAHFPQDAFGDDRARAVAGAQEQNVEDTLSHEQPPSAGSKG